MKRPCFVSVFGRKPLLVTLAITFQINWTKKKKNLLDDHFTISLTLSEQFDVTGDETKVPAVDVVDAGRLFSLESGEIDEGVQLVMVPGKGLKHFFQVPQDDGAFVAQKMALEYRFLERHHGPLERDRQVATPATRSTPTAAAVGLNPQNRILKRKDEEKY